MRKTPLLAGAFALCTLLPIMSASADNTFAASSAQLSLLAPWTGPYGGVPPWDRIGPGDFPPAFEQAMADQRSRVDAIAQDKAPPTFDNTILAYERAGRDLARLRTLFSVYTSTLNVGDVPALERELAPKFAAFEDSMVQNRALFRRIDAVYGQRASLPPEQQRLTWLTRTHFVRHGALLDAAGQTRMAAINLELAGLFTRFSQNLLAEESERYTVVDSAAGLAGLAPDAVAAAAASAKARGIAGRWVIDNTRSAVEPFLTLATDRALREKVWRVFVERGNNDDSHDNNALISRILALRHERALLLGYPTHAHWSVELAMAGKPERTLNLMMAVWKPAVAKVRADVAEMQALAKAEGADIVIAPWDYRYYAARLRERKYGLDMKALQPYLALDRLQQGMFKAAERLYGLRFVPARNVPVQHPAVQAWEVWQGQERQLALFIYDPYARAGKSSGAWMNYYREQHRLDGGALPIVSNNTNFIAAEKGQPVLLSWTDAVTLFHEFGHALHGMLSEVTYPSLAGPAVARDFVEFPSQINEHWLMTDEVLNGYARHYQTDAPIPPVLLKKLKESENADQGFSTVEYLSAALVDMKMHLAADKPVNAAAFERETLAALGMPKEIVMRHRPTQFAHVFSGDGYSAGYYAYLWADSLTADAWEAFGEGSGPWDLAVAKRFRERILAVGNTVDSTEAFRAFRGRDVDTAALMRKRGFASP